MYPPQPEDRTVKRILMLPYMLLCLTSAWADGPLALERAVCRSHVDQFNWPDRETVVRSVPNAAAGEWLAANSQNQAGPFSCSQPLALKAASGAGGPITLHPSDPGSRFVLLGRRTRFPRDGVTARAGCSGGQYQAALFPSEIGWT